MKKSFVILVLALLLSSCSYFLNQPFFNDQYRIHPLGMKIYNKTGKDITEQRWDYIFWTVDDAYKSFKDCVADSEEVIDKAIRSRPIIIIPPAHIDIYQGEAHAYTDLDSVFIRDDYFFAPTLRAEWVHIYLHETGKRFLGDFNHIDDLFTKCR